MREESIKRLERKIATINKQLVEKYDAKLLRLFLFLEKELEIQKAYKKHEEN